MMDALWKDFVTAFPIGFVASEYGYRVETCAPPLQIRDRDISE